MIHVYKPGWGAGVCLGPYLSGYSRVKGARSSRADLQRIGFKHGWRGERSGGPLRLCERSIPRHSCGVGLT